MFWFGENKGSDFNWREESLWSSLSQKKKELARTKLDDLLNLLDQFGKESFEDALPKLQEESGFSLEETKKTLDVLPLLLKKENLLKRIRGEFTKSEVLDQFVKLLNGNFKTKAVPKGILLHVTAGNVFLSSIDSLIMGLVTKNLSVIKVSSQNTFFPLYFAQKLKSFDKENILSDKFAILHWKGGDEESENFIKAKVDAIVAWGGEEMISSYQKNLPRHVKLIDFGPKISIQLISKEGLKNKNLQIVAEKIVADIIPWDQSACASPQNLYLEDGISDELIGYIDEAFLKAPPRGHIDEDEATEILKEKYRALYSELIEGGVLRAGPEHLLHLEKNKILKPSPLHRSLIIKKFSSVSELRDNLEPFSYYLQSCSYLLSEEEKDHFLEELSFTGVKRFAPLGTITWGMEGAPHDGRFVLRELVNFIGDEVRAVHYGESVSEVHNSSVLKSYFESHDHPPGYIFSSGGTTGEPKYLHFSYEEFDYMSDMLADNFRSQGIVKGMTVANLFVAGNLWSSFICVEKALEKIGVIQLPIGGMCSQENILNYIHKFKPDVVMGIPSMLVMNAEFMAASGKEIKIPMVFYAGEALSQSRREYLSKVWGTTYFGSAGYASVDAGVIGYQCKHCGPGEHHLFSDLVHLEVINEEAIVSSIIRDSMPIKNYRTGDRVQWISECLCGSRDQRFKLLGRIDNVIQIWSCRLLTTDIETSMNEFGVMTFQIELFEEKTSDSVQEKLKLLVESHLGPIDKKELLEKIYLRSRDLKDTITFETFNRMTEVEILSQDSISRNPRTGKISLVRDLRH
jgi:phenylacetate-coenzyme A ligase PaaK-like adenylate-forming protein